MEKIYILIIIVLFFLAISDLIVGVSNDAVNFLNSAIGSKAAPFKVIMIIAALGILFGATFSSGMMEVARKGIFYPGSFSYYHIMIIFLAVMLTDILLLDLFNTFGLPTSTTVSIVFELLGSAFGVAVLSISENKTQTLKDLTEYINTGSALAIISGILVSVVIAFSVGAVIQYISRIIFSFRYDKPLRYFGSIWGALAITTITYFILIKGAKGSSFMDAETIAWIKNNTWKILGMSLVAWTLIFQALILIFRLNILKVIVLVGTFALAMAFAGNDLVNFIGVPLAGFESFNQFNASAGADETKFMMSGLAKEVHTPTLYLLIAGLVMVITLWLSKKAKSVVKTTIKLSDQNETTERFESSVLARALVRQFVFLGKGIRQFLPDSLLKKMDSRFDASYFIKKVRNKKGVSFDLIRASVNLIVASMLIALGTSLKLPLSTTYVTFMVAMGTSLADGAWDRESAVYRITGVVTVIGGWFFTALVAFTISFLVAIFIAKTFPYGIFIFILIVMVIVYRTHILHKKKTTEENLEESQAFGTLELDSDNIYESCSNKVVEILVAANDTFDTLVNSLIKEKRKKLKNSFKTAKKLSSVSKKLKKDIPSTIQKLTEESSESGQYYVEVIEYLREAMHNMYFITEPAFKHVDNNHKPLSEFQAQVFRELKVNMDSYINKLIKDISRSDYSHTDNRIEDAMAIINVVDSARKKQIKLIKKESGSTRTTMLFMDMLNEIKNLILNINNMNKSFRDFSEQNKMQIVKRM